MPYGSIRRIKELGLNKRLTCKYTGMHNKFSKLKIGADLDNLHQIEIRANDGSIHDTQLTLATLNTRLLKPKEHLVLRELHRHNIDVCLVTESWLKVNDDLWIKGSTLNIGMFRGYPANCTHSVSGGIMLTCKSSFDMKLINKANNVSYEHATWQLTFKQKSLTLTSIYHPPPKNQLTNVMFTDELTSHLTRLLTTEQNNTIPGDFNMHMDDLDDVDAGIFLDTITTLGIEQHVNLPTHYKGNTLDLILSKTQGAMLGKVQRGALVSYHYLVYTLLNIEKFRVMMDTVTIRKISAITDSMLNARQ